MAKAKKVNLVQHVLIPLALVAGNIAAVHLFYLFTHDTDSYSLKFTGIGLLVLGFGVVKAHKYVLIGGLIFYTALLLVAVLQVS